MKSSDPDCTVSVIVRAWNSLADVSKWRWEENYSQHLTASNGKTFWELPFKSGKATIGVWRNWGQNRTQMEFRYPLVLKSIPPSAGKLVFHADIAANGSRRVPIEVTVRP